MAKLQQAPRVDVEIRLTLSLDEAQALDALAGYGSEAFLNTFYAHMGRHYLEPHEHGLRSLFKSVREVVPGIVHRTKKAREAFSEDGSPGA